MLVNAHITLYYALIDAYNAGDLTGVQVCRVFCILFFLHLISVVLSLVGC